ncbi:hypothetical protein PsorP6_004858 [Peronosclerospora sorghi]|uniref:Uncharacterized protein n=1 Tax=Peronosclerospora sorghi TaxID=230839 RepID=A0ACC0W4T6_9STRA|nr:hypothetical protein PsorP6_004858 [Peronosclerospora sorghi]
MGQNTKRYDSYLDSGRCYNEDGTSTNHHTSKWELPGRSNVLAEAARMMKQGCVARELMDFSLKFPAGIRKQTLRSLGRRYDKISAKQSEIAFKEYLTEFGISCSEVEKRVDSKVWGVMIP